MRLRRAMLPVLAALCGGLAVFWVVQNEWVRSSIAVGNAVPPIPALAGLLALGGIGTFLARRHAGTLLPRDRVLRIYLLMTVAAAIPSNASLGYLLVYITIPQYLSRSQSGMGKVAQFFPSWYAPPAGEEIRRFYEGGGAGAVPWHLWTAPLLAWGAFALTLMLTLYAVLALFRRAWMEGERLSYPMVQIPVRLMGEESGGAPPLWRDPAMWVGFLLVAGFDGMNMIHAFYPSFPSLGTSFAVGDLFPDRPWSSLAPMSVSYRPEIFGIGYLMPTDVLLTAWVSYLLLRLSTVARVAAGQQVASTAYDYQELAIGAFLCLFAVFVWRAWPDLRRSLRQALGRRRADPNADEPLSPRAAWSIIVLGTLGMAAWLRLAGLPWWLAASHLFLLIAVAVVYARMRAETGATSIYMFPFWQQQQALTNLIGTEALSGGSDRVLTTFSSLGGLSRGVYPQVCAYGTEGMSLAARARFPQRHVTGAFIMGAVLGLALGAFLYVTAAYRFGANQLDGGTGSGGFRAMIATQQYNQLLRAMATAQPPKPDLIFQTCLGAAIALGLSWLRTRVFWLPFHPMGFAMASAYGFHLWAPFLAVWICKVIILRFAGQRAYRRLIPLFLGFALGRYLFGGLVWGTLGLFGHPATNSYRIHFS